MRFIKPKLTFILSFLFLSLIFLIIQPNLARAQEQDYSENVEINFKMTEFGENQIENKNAIGHLNLTFPDSNWNLLDLDLNFSNIKLEREVKTIEDHDRNFRIIEKFNKKYGFSVQINLAEPTIVYGVYIHGAKSTDAQKNITLRIQGFNEVSNSPNSTSYTDSLTLNISDTIGWYKQKFPNPISLNPGNYSLILNGSSITSPQDRYYWSYNDIDPIYPNLYTSQYDGNSWSEGINNSTFLYRLIQKVNRSYNPEDINMTVYLNNTDYKVNNSIEASSGLVSLKNLDLQVNNSYLTLPVYNNESILLNYTYTYCLKIYNQFDSKGYLQIYKNKDSKWTITPEIDPCLCNYSIKFSFPESWYKLDIFQNSINITSEIVYNHEENYILILNETINSNDDFLFIGYSENLDIPVNLPKVEYNVGQEIFLSVDTEGLNGNLNIKIINSIGFKISEEQRIISSVIEEFSYKLSDDAHDGEYEVLIFWNNQTNAGVNFAQFQVNAIAKESGEDPQNGIFIDPSILISIILIGSVSTGSALSGYEVIKRFKEKSKQKNQEMINQCHDALNTEFILISMRDSGVDIFSESFGENKMNPTLISGFLEAIANFGIELTDSKRSAQTIKLQYEEYTIYMAEYKNIRLIFVLRDNPSENFSTHLKELLNSIYSEYGDTFENFNGDVRKLRGIKNILNNNSKFAMIAKLKINPHHGENLSKMEENLVQKARRIIKNKKINYFYATHLLPKRSCDTKTAQTLLKLINKKIFVPLGS